MQYRKQLFLMMLVGMLCSCIVMYTMQLAVAKQAYYDAVKVQITQFLTQQQDMLQRLGKQLVKSIQGQDPEAISLQLRTYEDQIFGLAKQGLTVPVKIQWVSLDVPPQNIDSTGVLEHNLIADEEYYLQIVAHPGELRVSNNYTKPEMPEYTLLNMGLGIVDAEQRNLGLLDVAYSLESVNNFIAQNLAPQSKLFGFKLHNLATPEIVLQRDRYWQELGLFTALGLLSFSLLYFLVIHIYQVYKRLQTQDQELVQIQAQLVAITTNNAIYRSAFNTQMQYGVLSADPAAAAKQIININDLLNDMYAVNAELAATRQISVKITRHPEQLQLRGNRVRLMRILSGILYEIIAQLPPNSTIQVHLEISEERADLHTYKFKFTDNGFYNSLTERHEPPSTADIRAKGWSNIAQLIAQEDGSFAHLHTAYSGNTIVFAVTSTVVNNVIKLENYLQA